MEKYFNFLCLFIGGDGFETGGGGAGGRIAIECGRSDYTGQLFTHGGSIKCETAKELGLYTDFEKSW